MFPARRTLFACLAALALLAQGCSVLRLGDNFPRVLANHPDPETVAASLPGYLLLLDSLIREDRNNEALLMAGAKLHVLYAGGFLEDPERVRTLARRAYKYATRALTLEHPEATGLTTMSAEAFQGVLAAFDRDDMPLLFTYGISWLLHIKANAEDWSAVAELPRAEDFFDRMASLDETYEGGAIHLYLGILRTLRPPALGGDPERGRAHFERAFLLSENKNLTAKTELARRYARMLYDRELHDRLLREVLEAPVEAENFTLTNALAKRDARRLLDSADDYF